MNATAENFAAESSKGPRSWHAQLDLRFAQHGGRTLFSHCEHRGPLRVQRLFHPEPGGKAHCYLLHPPGGVVTGDELNINVTLHSGAALLTTPSAGRFYSVDNHPDKQRQSVRLRVESGRLEWLPQETILFNGVNAALSTSIDLADSAQLAFWDVLVLGRPACADAFHRGQVAQSLRIFREGRPLLLEQFELSAGDPITCSRMGLRGHSSIGIMVVTLRAEPRLLEHWLESVNTQANAGDFTVTQRGELLVARYLGEDAQRCRSGFAALWSATHEQSEGSPPALPRIWHT